MSRLLLVSSRARWYHSGIPCILAVPLRHWLLPRDSVHQQVSPAASAVNQGKSDVINDNNKVDSTSLPEIAIALCIVIVLRYLVNVLAPTPP